MTKDYELTANYLTNLFIVITIIIFCYIFINENNEFNKLNEKFSVSGTPTIMFITKGDEETTLNRIVGDTSKEKTIEKFKVNGYIK